MKGRTSYGWRKVLPVYKEEAATLMGCTGAAKALMSTKMLSVKSAFSSPAPSCFNQEPSIDWQWTDWWGLLHELACAAGTSSATVCSEQTRWSHCFYDALLCLRQCDSLSKCISLILSIPVCSCQLTSSSSCLCECVWTASEQLQLRAGSLLSPWVWFWAADSLPLARGRWGGVGRAIEEATKKPSVEARVLQAWGRVWWVTGTCFGDTRWPGRDPCQWNEGTLCHSVHLQPVSGFWQGGEVRPAVATQKPAVKSMKIHAGQEMSQNASTWCWWRESVAVIQTGSESMDMRRNEIGFGIWTAYLGEVKFKAHQKVQFHCRLGWVGFSAKGILFWKLSIIEHGLTLTSKLLFLISASRHLSPSAICALIWICWLVLWYHIYYQIQRPQNLGNDVIWQGLNDFVQHEGRHLERWIARMPVGFRWKWKEQAYRSFPLNNWFCVGVLKCVYSCIINQGVVTDISWHFTAASQMKWHLRLNLSRYICVYPVESGGDRQG